MDRFDPHARFDRLARLLGDEALRRLVPPEPNTPADFAEIAFSAPSISKDGRYVAFIADTPAAAPQAYVLDRALGTTQEVS